MLSMNLSHRNLQTVINNTTTTNVVCVLAQFEGKGNLYIGRQHFAYFFNQYVFHS